MDNVTPETAVDYKAEFERLQSDYSKLKTSLDKTSSEVADYKRKERERMSEEEKKQAEFAEREAYYKKLERENAIHRYTSKMSSFIKDEVSLKEIATLMAEGNYEKAIEKQAVYLEKDRGELEKTIKESLMKQNPQPTPQSNNSKEMSKDQFKALPLYEKQKLATQNPELYKKMVE